MNPTTTTTLDAVALAEAAIQILPEVTATEDPLTGKACLVLTATGLALFELFGERHGEGNANLLSNFVSRQIRIIRRDADDLFVEEVG